MCGITGYLNLREGTPPAESHLRAMLGQIRHRGPDEFGIYLDDWIGLGSARLSIVDLAGGQQPIGNETDDLWIVYNGEIFNYPELRRDLEARGHRFSSHTDTEVIVHLFEEYGPACLTRLNGQFSFALWDARRRSLFLARDRLGVRPLFFTVSDGALFFGSEIKALFAHPKVSRALDPAGVAQVFQYWSTLAPQTCFAGISELPPGHFLVVEQGKISPPTRYWQLDFNSPATAPGGTPPSPTSPKDIARLADELADLLVDATRIRLRADVPVGAYLSGGLDSSVIAAIIRSSGISHLDTFSIAFTDEEFDESVPQQRMAALLGTDHQVVRASHSDIAGIFPDVVWHAETALTRTAPAPMLLLSRAVQQQRYKVVLTGEGADEFLAGYDIFKEAKVRRFWAREPGSSRRPQLFQRLYPEIGRLGASAPAFVRAFFGAGFEDTGAPDYSHQVRWHNSRRTDRFLSADFAAVASAQRKRNPVVYPGDFGSWDPLHQAQFIEASTFLPGYLLSSQGDRVAMAHGVEGRYPFLDHRVVEFCNSLPPSWKMPALREKWLLRKTASRWLPSDIAQRRKRPYRAPIGRCFGLPGAPDYIAELFSENSLRRSGIFNPQPAARLYQAVRQGRALGETDEMALIGILSTELLVRLFIREYAPRPGLGDFDRMKRIDHRTSATKQTPS